jgi:hypothetical protein
MISDLDLDGQAESATNIGIAGRCCSSALPRPDRLGLVMK